MTNKSIKKINGYPLMDEKNRTDIENFKVECDGKFNDIASNFSTEQTSNVFKIKYNGIVIAEIPISGGN